MDEIRLTPVTFAELSSLRHETLTSETRPFEVPEFLVIRYFGVYRDGSAGHGDALYIVATAAAAEVPGILAARCWISALSITAWGDEMECVTSIGWNRVLKCHEPVRILVGEELSGGFAVCTAQRIRDILRESVEQAFARCREDRQQYEKRLREHYGRA